MRRLSSTVYCVCGVILLACFVLLDASGLFIYVSYVPAYLGLLLFGLLGLFVLARPNPTGRGTLSRWLFGMTAVFVLALGITIPHIRTSGRKAFWLDARLLRQGMPTSDARKLMVAYPVFDKYLGTGRLTFSFRSGEQTEDHVVLTLNEDGLSVRTVEFSAD